MSQRTREPPDGLTAARGATAGISATDLKAPKAIALQSATGFRSGVILIAGQVTIMRQPQHQTA